MLWCMSTWHQQSDPRRIWKWHLIVMDESRSYFLAVQDRTEACGGSQPLCYWWVFQGTWRGELEEAIWNVGLLRERPGARLEPDHGVWPSPGSAQGESLYELRPTLNLWTWDEPVLILNLWIWGKPSPCWTTQHSGKKSHKWIQFILKTVHNEASDV